MQLYNCTLYHEISSQNYATIQLYNILRQFTHSYVGYFSLLVLLLRLMHSIIFFVTIYRDQCVTLPKYVSIRQDQDEKIDIIVTERLKWLKSRTIS